MLIEKASDFGVHLVEQSDGNDGDDDAVLLRYVCIILSEWLVRGGGVLVTGKVSYLTVDYRLSFTLYHPIRPPSTVNESKLIIRSQGAEGNTEGKYRI